MGGSVGNTIGRVASGVVTLGGSEIARKNLPQKSFLNQAFNAPGTILTGGMYDPGDLKGGMGLGGQNNPYISGPFALDPTQMAGDQQAITNLGKEQFGAATSLNQNQYDELSRYVNGEVTSRSAARQQLADALTKQAAASFQYNLPDIEEKLNSQNLLNGSGLGQEIARQQGKIASDITNQVGVLGAQDVDLASQQRLAALQGFQGGQTSNLQGLQGTQTGALQRGLSLEDFINQANVAKQIGAQMAPSQPNGKQNFGTVASGIGSLAPIAALAMGGPGAGAAVAAGQKYGKHG